MEVTPSEFNITATPPLPGPPSSTPLPGTDTPIQAPAETTATISPVEKTENDSPKKSNVSRGKKRKKAQRDSTAPRQPLTGYVRFLNNRREKFRAENPNMPFAEITKVLAAEWSNLPSEQKQQYLSAAEQDRERYLQEVAAYKQSESYRLFSEQQANRKPKDESEETLQEPENNMLSFDIPIFTEEFLDHNKVREAELRQLRKSNTDYEQQNATIQTYIAGLHAAIEKLSVETQQQRNNNNALEQHLTNLRTAITTSFSSITIPGLESPTIETVDNYMSQLLTFLKEDPSSSIVGVLRTAVTQLDIQA